MKDTKEKLIKQALKYFCENDYRHASLNDIAGSLGITKGAIYHYFGSKDELFKTTVLSMLKDLDNLLSSMINPNDTTSFKDILKLWFDYKGLITDTKESVDLDLEGGYGNIIYLLSIAMKKFPDVRRTLENTYQNSMNGLEDLLVKAQIKGEIKKEIDTKTLAFEMTAFAEGFLLMGSLMTQIDFNEMGKKCFESFLLRIQV